MFLVSEVVQLNKYVAPNGSQSSIDSWSYEYLAPTEPTISYLG
jgi:hypothetical protein